ncbi:MAG: branched-chain amino acid ABC transporter permease [SAR324 cluster bacterium]|nr:branched-chain amino acid ABC transporter permease [SAR324 cluster bacterium]
MISKRTALLFSLLTALVLVLFFDGGRNMWRAAFISLIIFLVLTVGVRKPKWAAAVLLGVAVTSFFAGGINFWRSLVLTLVVMVMLAMAIERVVLRHLVNQEPILLFMATIGLNFVLEGIAQGVWDSDVHGLDIGIEDMPFDVYGVFISKFDIFAAISAGLLVLGIGVFFTKTRVGRALRAVADDHQAAMAVGISLNDIWAIVWSASGIVALFAGLLWGSKLGVQFSLVLLAFKALPVLILGGFTSVPGAIIGGLIVGATEKVFEVFIGIEYLGGGTESWSPYMLAMIFLLFRPQGLFGEKIIERV